ncbi:hypothetical protein CBR_g32398 [Chara braunii]|uniref:Uncharacterized protein n=1 Tax=Chara braunii TaxID=69332 RepID=A0A388JYH0_CHABU|nr:hypothetical protein CBR_g32398 [Chara braunii]|eukprot:GBG62815.1 hypothetical protein CBR_g32398 [Chara braunii]
MRNFPKYLAELEDAEPLPQAEEDMWELHRALYRSVVLGMFRFDVSYDDHNIAENLRAYYVISRPKPKKEGTVALYPFGEIGTSRPGLLELIHIELLSTAKVIASEEEDFQLHLRTASAPRRSYHAVVIPDYIAREGEKVDREHCRPKVIAASLILPQASSPEGHQEDAQEETSPTITGGARKPGGTRRRGGPGRAGTEARACSGKQGDTDRGTSTGGRSRNKRIPDTREPSEADTTAAAPSRSQS